MGVVSMRGAPARRPLEVVSHHHQRLDAGDVTASVCEDLATAFASQGDLSWLTPPPDDLTAALVSDGSIDARTDLDAAAGDVAGTGSEARLSESRIRDLFHSFLAEHLGPFGNTARSLPTLRVALFELLREECGADAWPGGAAGMMAACLIHRDRVGPLLDKAITTHADRRAAAAAVKDPLELIPGWSPPAEDSFAADAHENSAIPNYLYETCLLRKDRSVPERRFEVFLASNAHHLAWWWKSRESQRIYLGVQYRLPRPGGATSSHLCFPDYFTAPYTGPVGVIEVKDITGGPHPEKTKAKARALVDWAAPQTGVVSGVVVEDTLNGRWMLCTSGDFDPVRLAAHDWTGWTEFVLAGVQQPA